MMKVLKLIGLSVQKVYWDQACKHQPMHPDVPRILLKRLAVREELSRLWSE